MIAADVFAAFAEVGFDNEKEIQALGRRYSKFFFPFIDKKMLLCHFYFREPNLRSVKF